MLLAVALKNQGKLFEAEAVIVEAINILKQRLGETHQKRQQFYYLLVCLYCLRGRLSEVNTAYVRMMNEMKSHPDENYNTFIKAVFLNSYAKESRKATEVIFDLSTSMTERHW